MPKKEKALFLFLIPTVMTFVACSSPEKAAEDFCAFHAAGQLESAYNLLSARNRAEISENDYSHFNWDQRTFDLRLLQKRDICHATVLRQSPTDAITSLEITLRGDDKAFSCMLPLIKEDGNWKVTSYWQPALDYKEQLRRLHDALLEAQGALAIKDDRTYLKNAGQPLADYYDNLSRITNTYQMAKSFSPLAFCFSNLNPDGGQAMAYNYLIFERKLTAFPQELLNQEAKYRELLELVNKNYAPEATSITRGVRWDLLRSKLVFEESDSSSKVEYYFAVWGKIKEPLSYQIDIFDKSGAKVQEGHGKEADIISDFPAIIPDAPPLTLVVTKLPKLPSYTARLEIIFSEPDQLTSYRLILPVKREYLD